MLTWEKVTHPLSPSGATQGSGDPIPIGHGAACFLSAAPSFNEGLIVQWLTSLLETSLPSRQTLQKVKRYCPECPPNRLNSIEKLFISKMKTCPRKTVHLSLTSNVYALLHNLASMLIPIASFDSIYCSMKSEMPPQTQMRKHSERKQLLFYSPIVRNQ